MKLRFSCAAALALALALNASGTVSAQSRTTSMYNYNVRLAQNTAPAQQVPSRMASPPAELPAPAGQSSSADVGYMSGAMQGGYSQGYGDGYGECGCDQGFCDSGCCDSCGGCGSSCSDCCGFGNLCGGGGGQAFFTADYLLVHSSFSEADAYVQEDVASGTDTFVPLNFGYNSSYRFGGGYRSCCCGDEIRFLYTRMTSDASAIAVPGDIVPYETAPPPGGHTDINANVDAKSFDLECAKTIPLGGQCCECGDSCGNSCGGCGCGSCCSGPCCPAWDITWSGGVRWADVGWNRSYVALDTDDFPVTDSRIGMIFRGGGIRTGLEGRRYFGHDGCVSIYGKGNISLLLGDVHVQSIRTVDDPTTNPSPDAVNTQNFHTRQIIPVTELEGGVTAQVSSHTAITAGYLFAAWHDLGFRDEHELNTLLPTTYDDANILGFDGFFARVEVAF
jgi:hypothetical protein